MNEINTKADQGELERCGECGTITYATMIASVVVTKTEIVSCLDCHVENGRLYM